MLIPVRLRCVLAMVVSLVALAVCAQAAEPMRVLILSGSNNHDWKTTTPALQAMLRESGHFRADVTEDPASLDAAMLAPYDLILSNWNNWPSENRVWGEKAEGAVLDFVRGGNGFALVHAASACFGGWAEYQQLVGATWDKAATAHGAIHERQDKLTGERSRLTREIRRLIEVLKSTDRVPADLKRECLELDEQKQRVQTELEKVQIEINRTGQQALDLEIIQRSP